MAPMNTESKSAEARVLERFNLRLLQETVEAIDSARARRIGNVSRNTWIMEAIAEKLRGEGDKASKGKDEAHDKLL